MAEFLKKSPRTGRTISVVVLMFTSLCCIDQPLEPVLPSWDTDLTFPLISRVYTLGEFAEQDTSVLGVVPGDTRLVFKTSATTQPVFVNDLLRIDPFSSSVTAELGSFSLLPVSLQFPLSVPGVTEGLPLPPLSSIPLPNTGVTFSQFQEVVLERGTLQVTLRNNLPATIRVETPIELRDGSGNLITTVSFVPDSIPTGTQRTAVSDLAGATLTSNLSVMGSTVSSPGSSQPVPSGDQIVATVEATGLVAERASLANIPPQVLVDNSRVAIPLTDSTRIREAIVGSGSLFLQLESRIDLSAMLLFRFSELLHPDGTPYQDSLLLQANGRRDKLIDLAGFHIQSQDGSLMSSLEIYTTVNLYEGSAGLPVTVRSTDQFTITASSSTIIADSLVGVIRPTTVAFDERIVTDLGDLSSKFSGQLYLPSATMRFTPQSSIQFPLELDLQLRGRNTETGAVAVL
ncbi:MAG: hypothetical protein KAJ12_06130, partial [Bacteroidetes bacterium]|nr:hypothetical protein [Bacteroidota bacterium]